MAQTVLLNEIVNRVSLDDQTAEGAASAGRNLDSVTTSAESAQAALTEMGAASNSAAKTVADSTDTTATALQETANKAATSIVVMQRSLRELRQQEADLQNQLSRATDSSANTRQTTENLSLVQAEISKTTEQVTELKTEQQAAALAAQAWNGVIGESVADINGYSAAITQANDGTASFFSGLKAGSDSSLKSVLRDARSVGDELASVVLKGQSAQEKLSRLSVSAPIAVQNGNMSQADATAALSQAQALVDKYELQAASIRKARQETESSTSAIKLEGYQVGIVMDEAHKFLDMVLAGGSPFKAAFYELPNAVQVMGGLGNSMALVRGLMTGPAGLAVGAAALGASLVALGAHAEEEEAKLAQLSTQFRATRTDAGAMADAVTSAAKGMEDQPGWDKTSARTAATAIGGTYNFTGNSSDITSLSNIARNYGAVFGTLDDGLKAVSTAMTDPTAEIQALYKQHLPGVDAALVEEVTRLQAAGEQGKAYALVMGKVDAATRGAHENALTPLQRAMEDLKKTTSPLVQGLEDVAEGMGTKLLGALTGVLSILPAAQKSSGGLSGANVLQNDKFPEMQGMMQINTKFTPQYDVSSAKGNVDEGISRFQNFMKISGGNLDNALALYGGYSAGSAGGKRYASDVYAQDLRALPSDSDALITSESSRMGLTQPIANVIRGIALKESGGYQYDQRTKTQTPAEHAVSAGVIDNSRSVLSGAATGGYNSESWSAQQADITAYIAAQEKLLAVQKAGSPVWQETQEHINQARVALANTLSPQEKITQGLRDGLSPLQAQSGYWRSMAEVTAQFGTTARGTAIDQTALSGALAAKQQQLAAAYNDGTLAAQRQAASQEAITKAAGGSNAELQHAVNYQQAYNEALQDFDPNSAAFTKAVSERTAALDASTQAQQRAQTAQQNGGLRDNLTLLQAESDSIGQNSDQRQVLIATMQAGLAMHRQYGEVLPQEAQDYISLTGTVAQANAEYQHHEQVLSDVTGSISSMADTLTNDLTQGFVQGTASGISFKNILSGIETQIGGVIVKMGLINPLLNKIDGGTRTTLDDISQSFGASSGASSSSGAGGMSSQQISQYMGDGKAGVSENGQVVGSNGLSVSDIQQFFGSGTSVSGGSGASNDNSNPFAGVGQAANSSFDVQKDTSSATKGFGSFSDMMSGNGGLMSASGQSAATTLGGAASLAGGVLGGFTLGTSLGKMASGLTGGGQGGKIGSEVGSGVGSVVGAVFGGPIGSMIGGAVLGTIGGIIGGLFNKKHYAYDAVSGSGGQLVISGTRTKHSSDDVTAGLQTDLDTINSVYSDGGITVADQGYGEVGHYHKGNKRRSTSLEDLLPGVKLQSDDANENLALQQIMPDKFDSVSSYTQAIESIAELAQTLDALHVSVSKFDDATHLTVGNITGYTGDVQKVLSGLDGKEISDSALQTEISTVKELVGVTSANAESLVDQVADLRDKYAQAADQAKRYGLDYQVILDKGNAIAQQMLNAETTKLAQSDQSVQARFLSATGDQEGADLANSDVSAAQQRQQLNDEWQSYYGDSYATNADYQKQMLDLDKTLAAERLKIQETYATQAAQAQTEAESSALQSVTSVFQNLASYTHDLATSDASPLSVQEQYGVANDNLNSDYSAAMGGDYDAFSRLQSDAQTELSLSKNWYGSGTAYTDDYKRVLTMLQNIGNVGADTFTATLAKTLINQNTDAILQAKDAIVTMQTAITAELRQFTRVQAAKAA